MPAVLALDKRDALALDRLRQNHRRTALRPPGFSQRIENRREIVAVDDDGVPAEGAPAAGQRLHIVAPHRRAALAESVDIGDPAEAVEAVQRADVRRFPHGAFGGFAVAEHHVRAVIGFDAARVQRRADCRADALAERSGGDVDERQPRRWMTFQI